MIESHLAEERAPAAAPTRRQLLVAGAAVLGVPALAAVALAPKGAELKLGFVAFLDAALMTSERIAAALGRAGVAARPVPLASYGSLTDHLAVGAKDGGVDGAILPAAAAERVAGGLAVRTIGSLGGAGDLVLLQRTTRETADKSARRRLAASLDAHFEAARRLWPSVDLHALPLPPAQIGPNLQAGAIDLALLPERAARAFVEGGVARIAARIAEPGLNAAFALREAWIAAHPSAALALRDAFATTRAS
jgi:ABC-type nitrate/sulfonate/bicarbonate transport system substrate-binding protein